MTLQLFLRLWAYTALWLFFGYVVSLAWPHLTGKE